MYKQYNKFEYDSNIYTVSWLVYLIDVALKHKLLKQY